MKPKMRAIDMALKLNLDEEGNPKPQPISMPGSLYGFIGLDNNGDEAMPILIREEFDLLNAEAARTQAAQSSHEGDAFDELLKIESLPGII